MEDIVGYVVLFILGVALMLFAFFVLPAILTA
jgi:hypothetical protein